MSQSALEFLKQEATVNENGVAHVPQKAYLTFMNDHGVTREVLEATADAHEALVNGMYQYNAERLEALIPEVQKAGNDPQKAKVKTVVNILNGNIASSMQAAKTYPVPNSDTKVTKSPIYDLEFNQDRLMDKDMVAGIEAEFKKKFGWATK